MCSLFRNRFRYNSLRYAGRDYSLSGKYFVTICTAGTKEWFANVINSKMYLSEIGHISSHMWYEIPVHFPCIGLAAFVVMPDHIHGIIVINRSVGIPIAGALHATPLPPHDAAYSVNETMSFISPKPGSLSVVIRSYKSAVQNMLTNLTVIYPGSQDIKILSSARPGNCSVSENIFQIMLNNGI